MPTLCVLILVRPSGPSRKASQPGPVFTKELGESSASPQFSKGRCDGDVCGTVEVS